MFFVDTETHLIGPGLLAPPLVCVQVAQDDGPVAVAVKGVDDCEGLVREILQGKVVGHNVSYDLLVLLRQYPNLRNSIFDALEGDRVTDTLIREKLIRIQDNRLWRTRGLSLAFLAEKYGEKKNADDPWRLRFAELEGKPFSEWPTDAQYYAIQDVVVTRYVYKQQCRAQVIQGGSEQVSPDEFRQTRAAFLMHSIGAAGVHTDPDQISQFEIEIESEFLQDQLALKKSGLIKTDGVRNTKVAKARMAEVMKKLGEEPRLTKKGSVCLDEDACADSGDELLQAYQRYGSRKNLLSRIQALKAGLINPKFNSLVETGRTSCSKGSELTHGYQIQNMRRQPGERECFVPEPGNVFLACDYDSFELCTLAQVCLWSVGESRLASALKAGLDPHLLMGAVVADFDSYEAAEEAYKDSNHPDNKKIKNARQYCKIANFGYPGGMGSNAFRKFARGYGVKMSPEDAENLRENWFSMWPEMERYFKWINSHPWFKEQSKGKLMEVTNVVQMKSKRIRGHVNYTTACNSYFQGLAADAAKAAGFVLLKETEQGHLQNWKIWNFVHDEYILEGPEEEGDFAATVVKAVMEGVAQEWIPDVPIKASPTLMRRWSKNAEQVWENGKLRPWSAE